ncbi:MAG TPA: hypothetical protein VL053_03610 [Arachidicoccus sp.]|nr:hypothetical protein [Arachidicoccus sp.]
MKNLIVILFAALTIGLISCGKKKDNSPAIPKGYFVKTIELTFPGGSIIRSASFGYDDNNRIKNFEFNANGVIYQVVYTYNEHGLIVRADQDQIFTSSGRRFGKIFEFIYDGDVLIEHKENDLSYPVTYNAAENSYSDLYRTYYWDANNNLKKVKFLSHIEVEINYLSVKGVFDLDRPQMALAIFMSNVARAVDLRNPVSMDLYAFGTKEIGNVKEDDIKMHYFASTRDDNGNITKTEVSNVDGDVTRRYSYTYELREIK